jgi:branched-chain amino acid aminotransferase
MFFEGSKWVWRNGECVPWEKATIHLSAHGLHYGSGVFEGIRCYGTSVGPAIFRLDAHLDRLFASASVYGLEIPYSWSELAEAICEVVRRNGFRSCYIRPLCFFGSHNLSLDPTLCPVEVAILAWSWDALLGQGSQERGIRVTISPRMKFDSRMMPASAKACGQYLNSILAVQDSTCRGYDEALLLNLEGNIAEGSGENLFLIRNGEVMTNAEEDSILPGITRDSILTLARELGYPVNIQRLKKEDLFSADEAFLTGTAAEVTPIHEVDGHLIGKGERGPVTEILQRAFFAATSGRDPAARDRGWLHFVSQPVLQVK